MLLSGVPIYATDRAVYAATNVNIPGDWLDIPHLGVAEKDQKFGFKGWPRQPNLTSS